jgi:cation diffusion facilitator CzcD-associated flavoprotein CzcO
MKQRQPKRPTGPKRPGHTSHIATPTSLKLDRSYAQKVRTDRAVPNYESPAKRATFWANRMKALAIYAEEVVNQSLNPISQGTLKQNSQFATANVKLASLNSPPPTLNSQQSLLGPGGIAPPPPPV